MTRDSEHVDWPSEAGDRKKLRTEIEPPAGLEDRVVRALESRGLIDADRQPTARRAGWRGVRAALAAAACVALVAVGVLIGRMTGDSASGPSSVLTGAETDLYALLLYETDGYERPTGTEALTRYSEYSHWVAEAYRRGQFVTGEDLDVDRGWLLVPAPDGAAVEEATAVDADAPLSGIFFIRARDAEHALKLARSLPHLKHGGKVLVQKTIPTDTPPE